MLYVNDCGQIWAVITLMSRLLFINWFGIMRSSYAGFHKAVVSLKANGISCVGTSFFNYKIIKDNRMFICKQYCMGMLAKLEGPEPVSFI